MSSQSIAQIIAQISSRFKKLQTQLGESLTPESNSLSPKQTILPANSLAASKAETPDWWARLYRGLVMDETARHYRQMGQAVWLFLYFLLNANWKTGELYRRLSTICEETGFNPFAVRRWLRVLQRNGYVNAYYNGRYWVIAVNKWKPLHSLLMRRPAHRERWRS